MKYESKDSIIRRMRNRGDSLRKIGNVLNLSGECIRLSELRLGFPKRGKKRLTKVSFKCSYPKCKKVVMVLPTQVKKRKYCSRACFKLAHPLRPLEVRRAYYREKTKQYYHDVIKKRPDFHEFIKKNNDKALLRKKCLKK